MSTYTDSRRYYEESPQIHQSRGSSSDSRASYDSKRSTEPNYTSSKSTMGYSGGSHSKMDKVVEHKYRAPDAEDKYIVSKTRGNVEVINQNRRIYDPEAPLSSNATSSDYSKARRDEHRHSSHRSPHKQSSHRR